MSRPCDTGYCRPFDCSEYDRCLDDSLHEPSAGSIPCTDCSVLFCGGRNGPDTPSICMKKNQEVFVR